MTPHQIAARIAQITNWWPDEMRAPSRTALVSEYLRRAALWARALDCVELWAWFDVAAEIDPAARADAALVEQVNEGIGKGSGSPFEKRMAEYALHFAALPDVPHDLPDPNEPLIAAWERGGSLLIGRISLPHAGHGRVVSGSRGTGPGSGTRKEWR